MLSKKLLTAIKKAAGKKSTHPLSNTFHVIEKYNAKWLFATDSVKLFAVKLSEEYQLTTGIYNIDFIGWLDKYSNNNELLKPLQPNDANYTQSPDFWQIIPNETNEQANLSNMRFNAKYFTEMINFISIAENHKIPEINSIRLYKNKPAIYQTNTVVALLMPLRDKIHA